MHIVCSPSAGLWTACTCLDNGYSQTRHTPKAVSNGWQINRQHLLDCFSFMTTSLWDVQVHSLQWHMQQGGKVLPRLITCKPDPMTAVP